MRDLVETVIGQVLQQKPTMKPLRRQPEPEAANPTFQAAHASKPIQIKDKEIWSACCQFEAVFLQQMMEAMRKTVPESDFLPRGYANDIYDGMMNQSIAESGSKNAPLGLAMNMYRQLDRDGFTKPSAATQSSETSSVGQPAQDIRQITDKLNSNTYVSPPKLGGSHG